MSVSFGKIPLSISPIFWVTAGLIGFVNAGSLVGTLIWMFVIFISVLVHELGHAITSMFFGQKPTVALVALGGVTSYQGKPLKFWQQFVVVFNGPLFGLLLFVFSALVLKANIFENMAVISILQVMKWVNLFWSLVNLLPILPLDGGQLLRILLEGFFGLRGLKLSLFIGMLVAIVLSMFFFILQQFLIGAIFFLFAYQGFDSWRKARFLTKSDRNEQFDQDLKDGQIALEQGKKQEAKELFAKVRNETKSGMLNVTATHMLALLEMESGEKHRAYELLLSIKKHINDETLCVLHELAYDEKNFSLVTELSTLCYQIMPSPEIALRNAKAFAMLKKAKSSGGWLQTALKDGEFDIEKILKESVFDSVKDAPEFKRFIG
jgi:stage IV sporulation protein FB